MQKLLIYWVCAASLLAGCSTTRDISDSISKSFSGLSIIYRPDIQQGNVLTQEAINKLRPGMTKTQARYLLGTPLLTDVFHQDRWDYLYSMQKGHEERTQERITLFFEDGRLARIEGDLRPQPEDPQLQEQKETVISVPDYTKREKGLFARTLEKMGVDVAEE